MPRDAVAGLSVAGLILPEAVAYAGIAGLPPQMGIAGAIGGGLVYALLGKSRFAIVSATSSSAVILAATLAAMGDGPSRTAMAAVVVALCGGLFLLAAAFRLGALTSFISRPVLRGFALGLAVTIIIGQLPTMAGVAAPATDLLHRLVGLVAAAPRWNGISLAVGFGALLLLLILRRFPRIPGAFLVLALGVVLSMAFDLPARGVAAVGPIRLSLTWPTVPTLSWGDLSRLAQYAPALVLILFAESWGTVRALALRHGDAVEPNREVAALGAANVVSALLQGMPVGAGFSAGNANEAAGSQSRASGLIAASVLTALVLLAAPIIAYLPVTMLSAVVIVALTHALDPRPLVRLWRVERDAYVAIGAALGVLAFGVLNGMILAIGFSLAALIRRLAQPGVVRLGQLAGGHDYVDVARHEDAVSPRGIGIWRPVEPLFFANAERTFGLILRGARADPSVQAVVVSLEESYDLDSTALDALLEFADAMHGRGLPVQLARVHDRVRDLLIAVDAGKLASRSSFSVDDAVIAVRGLMASHGGSD